MKKGGGSHSGHHHEYAGKAYKDAQKSPKSAAAYERKLGPAEHDKPGYHNIRYGQHRLNLGNHRLEYTNKPCKNRKCGSYGHKHPNCKCYAKGGVVDHFCAEDNMHEGGCVYYKGGEAKKGFNFSNFKKVKEDKNSVTMAHPSGHELVIAKASVTPFQRKQLEKLPIHAAEGADLGQAMDDQSEDPGMSMVPETRMPEIPSGGGSGTDPAQKTINFHEPEDTPKPVDVMGNPADQVQPMNFDNPEMQPPNPEAPAPGAVPNAPAPASALPSQKLGSISDISAGDVYGKELKAIQAKGSIEAKAALENAAIEKQHQADLQQAQNNWLKTNAEMQANIKLALDDVKKGHINPNHYLETMGTGARISTAIGLLLGGFSGGLNKTGVNPAAEWLTGQINRDIDSQKMDQENRKTVYSGYLDQYKNAGVADQMARATQLGIYASKLRESAAKFDSPLAQQNANIAATELEQKMIPLVNNAHLMKAVSEFNGLGGGGTGGNASASQGGTEAKFKTMLQSASTINPTLYQDQQNKYVPSVGVASHPMSGGDRERLTNLDKLLPQIDHALELQKKLGWTGAGWASALKGQNPITNKADAQSAFDQIHVQLNNLTGLNRLNDSEYKNYGSQIGAIGSMNLGGVQRTLENLRNQALMDRNSYMKSAGITPFADALQPNGLTGKDNRNLQIFLQNNPKFKTNELEAIKVLKDHGIISEIQ